MEATGVRLQHTRRMLDALGKLKEKETLKTQQLKAYLERLSATLALLVTIQFTLSLAQTTVFANVNKHVVGALSLLASLCSVSLACLGRHKANQSKTLELHMQRQRKLDKAEDAFTLELANCLADDGQLTSEEHQKLNLIYKEARDCVDANIAAQAGKYFRSIARQDGSGARHQPDPTILQGIAVQQQGRPEQYLGENREETVLVGG